MTAAVSADLQPHDWELRATVLRHFVDTTGAPSVVELAQQTATSEVEIAASLRRLADHHQLTLTPSTHAIWMAHPFSSVPTEYPVETSQGRYWANCAWDAFGVAAVLDLDSRTATRCAESCVPVELGVRDGCLTTTDGVVHFVVRPSDFWDNVGYT